MSAARKLSLRNNPEHPKKKEYQYAIKQHFLKCAAKQLSITECLSKTGPLTADLILAHIPDVNVPQSFYDAIAILAINYYAIFYMDRNAESFLLNQKNIYGEISVLVKDVVKETFKEGRMKSENCDELIRQSRDCSCQVVNVYYRAGIEGCFKHQVSSINSILLYVNRNTSTRRDQIENTNRSLQVDKFLKGNYTGSVLNLVNLL